MDTKYIINFTISRDVELIESTQISTKEKDYVITTILKSRKLVAEGIDSKKTTATIKANNDMTGSIYRTSFETTIEFKNKLDEKIGKKNIGLFLIDKSIDKINKIIRVHQYVNNKYHVFPINYSDLSPITIKFPSGETIFLSSPGIKEISFGPDKELLENTKKICNYFNNNKKQVLPIYFFGYAQQFYQMRLYRIAITEAQAAIEFLLDLILKDYLKKRNDETYNLYEKNKDKVDFVDVKLGMYFRLATNKNIENEFNNLKEIRTVVSLRNDIVHGSKSNISKNKADNAMKIYAKLFSYLLEFAKK